MTDDYNAAKNSHDSYFVAIDAMREKLASFRCERIQDATLYLGDCREILPLLPKVDAVVTDPPYGVEFKGKNTKHTVRDDEGYVSGDSDIGPAVVALALGNAARGVVFPGSRLMFQYPTPYEIGSVYCPSGAGLGRWGFTTTHPMLFYGKGLAHTRQGPSGFESFDTADANGHPCPKPVRWMEWSVAKCSIQGETILDPFMGSGTTGVACAKLGRKFIGVEIEEKYYNIAVKRITDAYRQRDLFRDAKADYTPPSQMRLLPEGV